MKIGKIYYLATILGGLKDVIGVLTFISVITTIVVLTFLLISILSNYPKEDTDLVKKFTKISIIVLSISLFFNIIIPSKEDYLNRLIDKICEWLKNDFNCTYHKRFG